MTPAQKTIVPLLALLLVRTSPAEDPAPVIRYHQLAEIWDPSLPDVQMTAWMTWDECSKEFNRRHNVDYVVTSQHRMNKGASEVRMAYRKHPREEFPHWLSWYIYWDMSDQEFLQRDDNLRTTGYQCTHSASYQTDKGERHWLGIWARGTIPTQRKN